MVDALAARFARWGGTLIENREVLAVGADGDVEVSTTDGRYRASAAVLAGLSPASVMRVIGSPVIGLENVGGPVHASVLDLALDTVHDGVVFGIDEPLYLSPHAPVADLAPPGCGLVTALRYTPDGDASSADEARTRLRHLAAQAGIGRERVVHERFLHRLVVANAFPTAAGGGLRGRPRVDALDLPNVFIAGDWIGPEGLIADAASSSGEAAGQRALAAVASASRARV
jgi:hypothetical protein